MFGQFRFIVKTGCEFHKEIFLVTQGEALFTKTFESITLTQDWCRWGLSLDGDMWMSMSINIHEERTRNMGFEYVN